MAVDKGRPANSGTLTVRVFVDDRNDHSPAWAKDQKFIVSVLENTTPFTEILRLRATDKDSMYGQLRYLMDPRDTGSDNDKYFVVNAESGIVQVKRFLDYETRTRYLVPVQVQDNGQRSATATVTINVIDENDFRPHIKFKPSSQVGLGTE